MRGQFEEQEDEDLKKVVLQLTNAANTYVGELFYGKDWSPWEDSRKVLLECIVETLRRIGVTLEDLAPIVKDQEDFEAWWAAFKAKK